MRMNLGICTINSNRDIHRPWWMQLAGQDVTTGDWGVADSKHMKRPRGNDNHADETCKDACKSITAKRANCFVNSVVSS